MNWLDVYRLARVRNATAAGYYHDNIRVDLPTGPVMVRIPIERADIMDLRIWTEAEVLTAAMPYLDNLPQLIHASSQPAFQVHSFIGGTLLNDSCPRGVPVDGHVLSQVTNLLARLCAVPADALPARPEGWPEDGDVPGFGARLAKDSRRVFTENRARHHDLYRSLGIPDDPFAPTDDSWAKLEPRRFAFLHCDIHRKNIIVTDDGQCVYLDWELALFGDPVYDLATHLHKTGYLPHEHARLIDLWRNAVPADCRAGFEPDLAAYLRHEQIKSVLVDAVRYAAAYATAPAPYPREIMVGKLSDLLATARRHWGQRASVDKLAVAAALEAYGGGLGH